MRAEGDREIPIFAMEREDLLCGPIDVESRVQTRAPECERRSRRLRRFLRHPRSGVRHRRDQGRGIHVCETTASRSEPGPYRRDRPFSTRLSQSRDLPMPDRRHRAQPSCDSGRSDRIDLEWAPRSAPTGPVRQEGALVPQLRASGAEAWQEHNSPQLSAKANFAKVAEPAHSEGKVCEARRFGPIQ